MEPVGQGVPVGAAILPPPTVQPVWQVLFTMVTLAGAAVKVGQQVTGAVVAVAVTLTQLVVVLRQRAKTVNAVAV